MELVSETDISEELTAIPDAPETGEGEAAGYKFPAELRGENAALFADHLLEQRGNNLVLDISEVERIDTPCVQVLLSTALLWRDDANSIQINGQSDVFKTTLGLLGIEQDRIEVGV